MSEIRVPELGESIVEATVLNWLKQVGDRVQEGEAVAELETDKVNVEVIAEQPGVIRAILKQAGETVAVGDVLCVLEDEPAPGERAQAGTPAQSPPGPEPVAGVAGVAPDAAAIPAGVAAQPSPAAAAAPAGGAVPPGGAIPPGAAPESRDPAWMRATPAVRRLAREHGVDLRELQTGPDGRITEQDVLAAAGRSAAGPPLSAGSPAPATVQESGPAAGAGPSAAAAPAKPVAAVAEVRADEERVRMSRRRLTIARRLVEVQHTAAMLTTFNEVDMTAILEIRRRRRDAFQQEHGVRLGLMSFFTKAVVGALKAFPRLNAEIQGDDMILKYHYDIGIAVATDAGLVVPVVRNADRLGFAEIERQIEELARKARSNTLAPQELQGGTFTITNGGVFGSLLSTPILNGPQVGILGMHTIQQRPVAVNGEVVVRPMMYLALSYDHRIVDGSEAVRFLVKVKRLLEDPESLLLEG